MRRIKLLYLFLMYCCLQGVAQPGILNVRKQLAMAQAHFNNSLKINTDSTKIPRSTHLNGTLRTVGLKDWCSGFFAGSLWYLYEYTHKKEWKRQAIKWTLALDSIQYFTGHHDIGFMMGSSYGNGLRLTNNPAYKSILVQSAKSLSQRFNKNVGIIKSWDNK